MNLFMFSIHEFIYPCPKNMSILASEIGALHRPPPPLPEHRIVIFLKWLERF
jgi:hypothetical protein